MRSMKTRTSVILVGASAAAVLVAGVASAYYLTSVSGTGTGTATPAANAATALTFAGSAISGLVPGGSAVSSTVTFTNPNPYAVSYPAKTIAVSSVSGPAGCATNAVALLSGSAPLAAGILAAGGTTTVSVPVSMADSTTVDQSACAAASLTITYSAS
jgi:hypothetical protein